MDWPGRLQHLTGGPLAALLPQGWELWLDGGHNPDAGKALAAHAAGWSDRPLHLVIAMMATKDAAEFLRPLAAAAEQVRCLAIPGKTVSLGAEELAAAARTVGMAAKAAPGIAEALRDIAAGGGRPARVLVCGSLYFAGAVLAENGAD